MNVITFDRAYCLYPRATLEERISLVTTERDDQVIEDVFQRYTQRGWRFIRAAHDVPFVTTDRCLNSRFARWINDGYAWSIPLPLPSDFFSLLPTVNSRTLAFTHDPASVTGWRLINVWRRNAVEMRFHSCKSVNLFYSYITASRDVLDRPSIHALRKTAKSSNMSCRTTDTRH